ncbi:MAG TPA: aminotransferase class V-fold PLP-dependent enzyme [Solirubrobacteraceae bacterium]|nr:aminotransferase class V-fold PLP-dependent enzyme [Solirubrobacteraceae bacterium]
MTRSEAETRDARDPLRGFRDRFAIDREVVYLDGNSLGCMPHAALARLGEVAGVGWGDRGVRSWDEGWLDWPIEIGDRLGAAVLGAAPGQVVIGDSTTVCFYKLVCAALDARPGRTQIITDLDNFPTDRYVLEGVARARDLELTWLDGDPETVAELVGADTALVTFSHVSYRSARIADMARINQVADDAGALMLWDLSHSAGSVPLSLDGDHATLAVGCTYKYLNGGPGAPAYMYVRSELQRDLRQPIWGWLGRRDPFEMAQGYDVAEGMRGFLSGTPPVLALAAVDEGVRVVAEAGIDAIRAKGIALTELAIGLADEFGISVASPRDPARRGAHVALSHRDAKALCAALIERGVIPDFRRPDVIRFGFSPLTTRFVDVWDGMEALRELIATAAPPGSG